MERTEIAKSIGKRIRKYRLRLDISQETLASLSGLHSAYIGRLERGEKCPTVDTLYKVSIALRIPVCELLYFIDEDSVDNHSHISQHIEHSIRKLPQKKIHQLAEIIDNIIDMTE